MNKRRGLAEKTHRSTLHMAYEREELCTVSGFKEAQWVTKKFMSILREKYDEIISFKDDERCDVAK